MSLDRRVDRRAEADATVQDPVVSKKNRYAQSKETRPAVGRFAKEVDEERAEAQDACSRGDTFAHSPYLSNLEHDPVKPGGIVDAHGGRASLSSSGTQHTAGATAPTGQKSASCEWP